MAIIKIRSPDDPRISAYRALPAHDARRRDGLFVAETRIVVRQLLESTRFATRSVLLTESSRASLGDRLALRPDVPAYVAPLRVLESIVGFEFHRGCVALGERGPELALDDLLAAAPRRLVLLEGVSNPDNVGGVLRVARALGADAAVLSPGCCDPLYRKAVRVSMGAALTLPFITVADWERAQVRVRAVGFTLIALTPAGDRDVAALPHQASGRTALLVGKEGEGLRAETLAAADTAVRIPMVSGVDSLNLVTACAIALDRLGWSRDPRTAP